MKRDFVVVMYLNVVLLQHYDRNFWSTLELEQHAENLSMCYKNRTAWMLYHWV